MNPLMRIEGLENAVPDHAPLHLAVGMFDGVHLGHRAVIESAVRSASEGGIAAALTFFPHPSALFHPDRRTRLIMSPDAKARVLERLGVRAMITQPFTPAFAGLEAEDFLPFLKRHMPSLASVHVGEAWRFGKGRRGDVALLTVSGERAGLRVRSVPRVLVDGKALSSTRIRNLLEAGAVDEANAMLAFPYCSEGTVARGRGQGGRVGFPTLNLEWNPELRPRFGVYRVSIQGAEIASGLAGVANFGLRPTIGDRKDPILEVHILGACPFGPGDRIRVDWLRYLREERRFPGIEDLRAQIVRDIEAASRG